MSKTRDRTTAAYWEERLFRNAFTYRGRTRRVPGWCIKVQWKGQRRTLRLRARGRAGAAREAVAVFSALQRGGWTEVDRARSDGPVPPRVASRAGTAPISPRKYVSALNPGMERELFLTLTADGHTEHLPLGTQAQSEARLRAQDLEVELRQRGWDWMRLSHAREATIAVFWMPNPMTCTYTTLLTLPANAGTASGAAREPRRRGWRVLVVEPEGGVRRALVHWLAAMPEVARVEGCAVVSEVGRGGAWDLVLANREQPAGAWRDRVASGAGAPARFLTHGIFADSDAIFGSFSGVKEGYLLRRVTPARLLEPVVSAFPEGRPARVEEEDRQICRYFQALFDPLRSRGRGHSVGLTTREQEVLDLLCRGFVDKEVAGELGISVWTVHSHLKRIFAKYGVRTRTEAVVRHLQK